MLPLTNQPLSSRFAWSSPASSSPTTLLASTRFTDEKSESQSVDELPKVIQLASVASKTESELPF